jgi:hypothetical protein
VSVHPQNTQDSAGFAQIAAYDSLKIRNSATPPVVYGFRGKQIHPDEQLHWSNESPFLKEILSRFHNSGVVPILPVICECDFLQLSVLPKLCPTANGCPISDILIGIGRELTWWLGAEPVSISGNHDGCKSGLVQESRAPGPPKADLFSIKPRSEPRSALWQLLPGNSAAAPHTSCNVARL